MAETGLTVFTVAEQESRCGSPVLNIQLLSAKQKVTFGIFTGEKLEITRMSLHFLLLLHWFNTHRLINNPSLCANTAQNDQKKKKNPV